MHNFPPHLSCNPTLPPENTLATEKARCFPLGGWRPTDDWWIPVFLKYSNIDQRVCDAHSWVNTRSKTRPNSQQLHSSRSATPWTPVNWIGVWVFLAASEDLWNYNCFKKLGLFWYCVPEIVNIGLGFWPNIFLTLTDQSTDYVCTMQEIENYRVLWNTWHWLEPNLSG